MTQKEMQEMYAMLYDYMAASQNPENMIIFGKVMNSIIEWLIIYKPEVAQEYIEQLCAIKWKNYLTSKEADSIRSNMSPEAPWSYEQWKSAMTQHEFLLEEKPCYNSFALFITMSMIYSDSYDTLTKYTSGADVFEVLHALALDKLKDADERFRVRNYFGL